MSQWGGQMPKNAKPVILPAAAVEHKAQPAKDHLADHFPRYVACMLQRVNPAHEHALVSVAAS